VGGGTRLKVLDALAMGKAIVSTSIGCEGLEVTNGQDIMIADNPVDFAEKTISLLRNKEKRTALGKAARALAELKYGWEAIGQVLQEVYQKSAAKRG
jgi:glycosyltransferase involved in cell wall biosynthesis